MHTFQQIVTQLSGKKGSLDTVQHTNLQVQTLSKFAGANSLYIYSQSKKEEDLSFFDMCRRYNSGFVCLPILRMSMYKVQMTKKKKERSY